MTDTEARVAKIPNCDIHKALGMEPTPAKYDASVSFFGRRSWGYVCERHFAEGKGSLGLGRGQKLVLDTTD
jgi:hypothetical protein